jgi:two-component system cell cycle sensor histidine kinase/response regulator CckA
VLRRDPSTWADFEHARLALARLKLSDTDSVTLHFERATEICARALQVDRVGIWSLDDSIPGLRCVHLLDRRDPTCEPGDRLRQADLGSYARALIDCRYIASTDVRVDPLMGELVAEYFGPRDIVATLDVPLYRDGEVVGVLCHEHRGGPRAWTADEGGFAISVAEMVAHALTTADLVDALEALREQERARHDALRADALGQVARGLAHDLGNSLQSIALQAEFLVRVSDDPLKVRVSAGGIRDLAGHAGRITRGMREFARGVDAAPVAVAIDAELASSVDALRALAGGDRVLTVHLEAGAARVSINPTGLERALANLVVNAREATRPGEAIRLSTSAGADTVRVEVGDDGHGMDEATQGRAFDPFFTTRAEAPQRGFGLSIVAAVIHGAGGEVRVESAPGKGARFVITLPRVG